MNTPSVGIAFSRASIACLALTLFALNSQAGTIVWSGASGTDTNWSDNANWVGNAAPGSGDDAKFFDLGSVVTASNINNIVDLGFAGTIASLQYGNTNGTHTTLITNGATLNVTGAGGLTVGTLTDNGSAQIVNATITGAGTLNVNNPAAVLLVDQGKNANANGTLRAILDMSG